MKPDDEAQGEYPFSDEVREWLEKKEASVTKGFIARYTDALGQRYESRQVGDGKPVISLLNAESP